MDHFHDLRKAWYQKLKDAGFQDAEDLRKEDAPLKEWHNLKFATDQMKQKMSLRAEYQNLVDVFTNGPDFDPICLQLIDHGNSKLTIENIKTIWNSHTQMGMTERSIAIEIKVSKTCVHGVIERLNQWMKLV